MTKRTILTLGSVLMELTLNTYQLPAPGETLYDDGGVGYLPSGYGTRSALALSRLGAESAILCKLGADTHGKKLYDFFKGNRIVTGAVKVDGKEWSARMADDCEIAELGEFVTIESISGVKLICRWK